jgi:hypothetical protein
VIRFDHYDLAQDLLVGINMGEQRQQVVGVFSRQLSESDAYLHES